MDLARKRSDISLAEYLKFEELSPERSEYVNGAVRELYPTHTSHCEMSPNLLYADSKALRALPRTGKATKYTPFGISMRLHVPASGDFVYSDAGIYYGKPQGHMAAGYNWLNPLVVMEIHGADERDYHHTEKFAVYKRIPSLREYLLLRQDAVSCEHFVRREDETWDLRTYASPLDTVTLDSVQIAFPLSDVYEDVEFEADGSEGDADAA